MDAKPAKDIANSLLPVVTLLSPADGDIFSADSLTVRYTVRSPSGLPVSEVRALAGLGKAPATILVVADILRGLALPPRHFITRLSPSWGQAAARRNQVDDRLATHLCLLASAPQGRGSSNRLLLSEGPCFAVGVPTRYLKQRTWPAAFSATPTEHGSMSAPV